MIRSGGTPNFSTTPAGSIVVSLMVFTSVIRSVTSCARSLSDVDTSTGRVGASCFAIVPMTSSASTPEITRRGRPMASTRACSGSICARNSSGMGGLFAL